MALLTKSKYLYGLQCLKLLWVSVNDKSRMPEVDAATQAKFDIGHEVGNLAKKLFSDGVDVPQDDFMTNINKTKNLINERKIIFEAGLMVNNLFSRADILRPNEDGSWDVIEVKSATQVKDVNLHDLSFQKFVYEKQGLIINKLFLMHLNNEYVKQGEINPNELFTLTDCTGKVEELIQEVPGRIEIMFDALKEKEPKKIICKNCSDPYDCALMNECWNDLPDNNVFNLYRGGQKSYELYNHNIWAIRDIPGDFKLNDKQQIQRDCEISGGPYIHKEGIKHFLNGLKYPLHYLDFETFMPAIPLFDGTRPYQQIPFQYSLHTEFEDGTIKHFEYLHDGSDDPRLGFITALKESLSDGGTIIAYNEAFEKKRLQEIAEAFPEFFNFIISALDRFVDLLIPFRNFHYYHPSQKGSASIKKVLPALTGKGYDNMDVAHGGDAMQAYYDINFTEMSEESKNKLRKDLLQYCQLDTEGMIWIKQELEKLVF